MCRPGCRWGSGHDIGGTEEYHTSCQDLWSPDLVVKKCSLCDDGNEHTGSISASDLTHQLSQQFLIKI